MRHIIPLTLIIVLIACAAGLAYLTPPEQFREFLILLAPACAVTALFVLTHYIPSRAPQPARPEQSRRHAKLKTTISRAINAINSLIAAILLLLFASNIAGVVAIYAFSHDRSFNDWRYGFPSCDEITQLRPVGTSDDTFTEEDGLADPNTTDPTHFHHRVEYFKRLREGPVRPIAIENIEAIKEARRILLPLRPYIVDSSNAHGIQPDVVATFVLVNRMIRAGYLTYDFRAGLAHALWHRRVFLEQRNMYDLSPLLNMSELNRWSVRHLPIYIRLQDRAVDVLGGLLIGASTTMGNMQIKADIVPGFEEEKNVRGHDLWSRFDVDLAGVSNRQINWMLLTDPKLDIEAGTAALRQSIDDVIVKQKEGEIVESFDLSLMNDDWLYYEVPTDVQRYAPDLIFAKANDNQSLSMGGYSGRPIELHDFTNYMRLSGEDASKRNYPLFHVIAMEAGVFDEMPGIVVGITTPEQVDYVYEIATGEDPYLRDAGLRSLEVLAGDAREDISESAKSYMESLK